ncbi:MAG: group III truncated hemoglobin [Paracoccaceae bacterium]
MKAHPMTAMPPRFDITPDQISAQMAAFYREIRRHPVLGPVFTAKITDWPAHEEKIASFWRNAILHERGYDGRPQQVHMATPSVQPEHFPIWLNLFEDVAHRSLPETAATPWVALARRIGDAMQDGVAMARQPAGSPPILR